LLSQTQPLLVEKAEGQQQGDTLKLELEIVGIAKLL
jgi:hypothetical protein